MSIDLYPIIKQIGDDKSGSTYLATNTLMPSRPYCIIKKLTLAHIDPSLQKIVLLKIKEEALILKNLGEEGNGEIPKIYDYFIKEDELYLVQEYVCGKTLFESVESYGLFSEKQVIKILIDILPTFVFIHARGILHGEVNPENIRLRENTHRPMLVNFGVVKHIVENLKTEKSILLNASESISREPLNSRLTYTSDLYSLGLTAIYLLTGKAPLISFDGKISCQIYTPQISTQLADILNIATSFNPHDRYADASEMLKALTLITEIDNRNQPESLQVLYSMKAGYFTTNLVQEESLNVRSIMNIEQFITNPVKKRNYQQSLFWDKADRTAVMIAGGVALGSAIAQLPGAVVGGMIAAGYAWYIRLS
jgi:serine/threonine protein kinase, bacterial